MLSDDAALARPLERALGERGWAVTRAAVPESPWSFAAGRDEAVVVVDSTAPLAGAVDLDLGRVIAVRPRQAGPDFVQVAGQLGLRAAIGRPRARDELLSHLGQRDQEGPITSETMPTLTDAQIDAALRSSLEMDVLDSGPRAGRGIGDRFTFVEQLPDRELQRWLGLDRRGLGDVEIALLPGPFRKERTAAFLDAGRRAQRLRHPNLIELVGCGQWGDYLYTASRPRLGRTLRDVLDEARGPSSLQQVARVGRQAAAALDLAHRHGLTHRALSPACLWIDERGTARLADIAGLGASNLLLTSTRELVNLSRAGYLAPERFEGSTDQGPATDAWSLGVLLYEMAAGFAPFQSSTLPGMREAVREARPPELRDANPAVPEGLAAVVHRLLDPRPERRPGNLRGIAQRLFAVEVAARNLTPGLGSPSTGR